MSGCSCAGPAALPYPHAPWLCEQTPGWDETWCDECGPGMRINPDCHEHGHLANTPNEEGAAA